MAIERTRAGVVPEAPYPQLTLWRLFQLWAGIGIQSFGGGAATTLLVQRTFIERYHVVTLDEFAQIWNLSLLAPGINLIAVAAQLGKRVQGTWGIVVALAGFLLPSGAITCLMAALFDRFAHAAGVEAAVRGIVPATGGIMLLVALTFLQPVLRVSRAGGRWYLLVSGGLIAAGTIAVIALQASPVALVAAAAAIGAVGFARGAHEQGAGHR